MGITQTPSLEVEGPMAITAFADPTSSHPKGRGTRQTTFSTALAYALMSSRRALFSCLSFLPFIYALYFSFFALFLLSFGALSPRASCRVRAFLVSTCINQVRAHGARQ